MKLAFQLRAILLALPLAACLWACGASQPVQRDEGVQDIEPGERSVIEPPARQAPASNIGERSI